jgi:hypothetical protein
MLVELKIVAVLFALVWLPGHALLIWSPLRRQWAGAPMWIVAAGLGIAIYPVLFYTVRFWLPMVTFGPRSGWSALLLCGLVLAWHQWRRPVSPTWGKPIAWATLLVFGLTLWSRLWVAHRMPYPAWSDSLHHVLLTSLTAAQGQLPATFAPYFPLDVDLYHLGLYALSATVSWLAQVPAHSALLWTAQFLNGLCGLGLYLILERMAGRSGAVVGAAMVGLFCFQPAFYVNWGRFTQLASQTLMPIAWLVTLETIELFCQGWVEWRTPATRAKLIWAAALTGVLTAAVFLLHFRVASFYLPFLLIGLLVRCWPRQRTQWAGLLAGLLVVGFCSLFLILPTLWAAFAAYLGSIHYAATAVDPSIRQASIQQYYTFHWVSIAVLAGQPWLLVISVLAVGMGLLRRNALTVICLLWVGVLFLEGNAYLLGIPLLMVTNMSGILIMFYLPIGLVIGAAAQELVQLVPQRQRTTVATLGLVGLLLAGLPAAWVRAHQLEPYRFFVMPADVRAMDWIRANVPADARFAVNTEFWLPTLPHGVDAGYWLPYFTQRSTTAGVMIMRGNYAKQVKAWSEAVVRLESDLTAVDELRNLGVGYIYLGARGDFRSPGLQLEWLKQSPALQVLYEEGGVAILRIHEQ